jgi:hypothetical protein
MPPKNGNDNCSEERRKAVEKMNDVFTGLSKRFSSPEQFLDKEFLESVLEINKEVLPHVRFERTWTDHFKLLDALVKANNKENTPFLSVRYERLGNLGILLVTEMSGNIEISENTCNLPIHPFAMLLAANIKHQFRDLSIKLKPTVWKGRTSETEITMQ